MAESPITSPEIERLRQKVEALENSRRCPLPTPETGAIVWFFKQGDTNSEPIAALVTGQDGSGQLSLELHQKNSQSVVNVSGIHFASHPFLETNPQVAKMKNGGVWMYRPGQKMTELHKERHLSEIDAQMKAVQADLLTARRKEIERQTKEKELAAATGTPAEPEKSTKKATPSAAS